MKRAWWLFLASWPLAAQSPLLLQRLTMNSTQIVFSFAGDLWAVARQGGEAQRLTAAAGVETDPIFSPDGKTLAFSGEYDGNVERLTFHPDTDEVAGWTPNGKSVLFRSTRTSATKVREAVYRAGTGWPAGRTATPNSGGRRLLSR